MAFVESPAVTPIRPTQTTPLIELVNLSNKLVLDNVYLNGLHALRRFELRNISPHRLAVKLRSNLGSQIAFQLTNENLPDRDLSIRGPRKLLQEDSSTSLLSVDAEPLGQSMNSGASSPRTDRSSPPSVYTTPSEPGTPAEPDNSLLQITTNTVAAAAIGAFGTESNALHGHQFNQLFNYVNHIDEVQIEPGQSRKIILAFLPDVRGRGRGRRDGKDVGMGSMHEDGTDSPFLAVSEEDETYDFAELNGLLFFFAYRISRKKEEGANAGDAEARRNTDSTAAGLVRDMNLGGDKSNISLGVEEVNDTHSSAEAAGETNSVGGPSPPDFQITVKFRSRVCRSVLWTDVGETGIIFDDCIVGGTYFKDFTVWNRSEIDLYWVLNTVDLSNRQDNSWLKFSDHDTGEPLDGKPIPSYSHRRIRVTFRPRDVGEFNYDLQLENANDSANTIQALIHAVVRSGLREESLVISSGNVIDFGDCCAGVWSKQRLVIRNISEAPLEVNFSVDDPSVVFQLKSDDLLHETSHHSTMSREAGEHLLDRLQELSLTGPGMRNEFSNPPSEASSQGSSPNGDSELLSMGSGELLDIGSSTSSLPQSDDEDSDGLEIVEKTVGEGVGSNGEEYRRIEELTLRPGTERTVEVCYRPEKDPATADHRAGRLMRRNFRIVLTYAHPGQHNKERKTIQCKARTCTSLIDVIPKEVNFGDTDVGTLKSAPIQILNCSDVTARVELRFVSKVLNSYRGELIIPPKQSLEVKIDIYPRKVNPDYRKQITVVNLLNRDDDQIVEVRSTNIDKHRVTFHSLYYRILTPTSTNFIDFGAVILNSPTIRTFTIDNISKKRLVLELSSSMPDDVKIFMKGTSALETTENVSSVLQRREKLLESMSDRRKLKRATPETPKAGTQGSAGNIAASAPPGANKLRSFNDLTSPDNGGSAEYLDLASSHTVVDGRLSPKRRPHKGSSQGAAFKQMRVMTRDRMSLGGDDDVFKARAGTGAGNLGVLFASVSGDDLTGLASRPSDKGGESQPPDRVPSLTEQASGMTKSSSLVDMAEESRLSIDSLISLMENATGNPLPLFSRPSSEEKYVRGQLSLRRQLDVAIKDGRLLPVTLVDIPPESEQLIVLVFVPAANNKPYITGKARKQDARIFLRLVEFDRDIQQPQFEQLLRGDQSVIPVRELMLRSTLCRSVMDLGQKHINFGTLDKNEHRIKSILIRNNSEAPLLYAIRKSGSIASGDIIIGEGRMGIVRANNKKEVEFVFDPSLPGLFHEHLTIENIQDRENDQTLSVKANIRKPANFSIETQSMDFGVCLINEASPNVQFIVISNTSFKKTRTFEVRIDRDELRFEHCVVDIGFEIVEEDEEYFEELENGALADGEGSPAIVTRRRRRRVMMLSKEMEEEIEHLEQKLKIAKRKGRKDKLMKLVDKLDKLRAGIVEDQYAGEEDKKEIEEKRRKQSQGGEERGIVGGDGTTETVAPTPSRAFSGIELEPTLATNAEGNGTKASEIGGPDAIAPSTTPSTANAAPLPVKVRRTENSMIFPLEPRAIKTIAVYFRPMAYSGDERRENFAPRSLSVTKHPIGDSESVLSESVESSLSSQSVSTRPSEVAGPLESSVVSMPEQGYRESCTGRVFVHEYKNTDVTKKVSFKAIVCYDHPTYLEVLSEEADKKSAAHAAQRNKDAHDPGSRSPSPRPSFSVGRGAAGRISPPSVEGGSFFSPSSAASVARLSEVGVEPSGKPETALQSVPIVTDALVVELAIIDLGKVEVNERKDCYFTLSNRSDAQVSFEIIGGALPFQLGDTGGTLSKGETRRIDLSIVTPATGRQSHSFVVRNISTGHELPVTFKLYGIASTYLRFPSLPDPDAETPELDLGFCYVDPSKRYAKVIPFEAENTSENDLIVNVTSNLAQQCFIFGDPALETNVTDARLLKGGKLVVYVALQPNLGGTAGTTRKLTSGAEKGQGSNGGGGLGGSGTAGSSGGGAPAGPINSTSGPECRTLIGGIRFLVQTKEEASGINQGKDSAAPSPLPGSETLFALMTQTVKFTSVIGQSLMAVSDRVIDLGWMRKLGSRYSGRFAIWNISPRMPLEYTIQAPSGRIVLSRDAGRIEPRPEGSQTSGGSLTTDVVDWVDFTITCETHGLLTDFINVCNANNSAQNLGVEVRLFVDGGWIALNNVLWRKSKVQDGGADSLLLGDEKSVGESDVIEQTMLPFLQWDDVYVTVTAAEAGELEAMPVVSVQRSSKSATMPSLERSLELENLSNESIEILPKSDLDIVTRCSISGAAPQPSVCGDAGASLDGVSASESNSFGSVQAGEERWRVCGDLIKIGPKQKVTVGVAVPKPTSVKEEDLKGGGKVKMKGTLFFQNTETGIAAKMIDLLACYAVSTGEVDPTIIDLGKVGHFNSWNDVKFSFTIRNKAAVPLYYDVDLPDSVDIIAAGGDQNRLGSPKRRIEALGKQVVEAVLKPRQLDLTSPGPRTFSIGVTNLYNPRDVMVATVTAQLTLFELRFERLVSGELVLPPLYHPHVPSALPCDTWFTIVNTSDEDAKFEIGFSLAPDVSEFIRLDVLSRFSNSPLVGTVTLAPRGSIEVRVRAYAREDSRLPANHPNARYLTNPDGVTFGTLWVTSKNQAVPALEPMPETDEARSLTRLYENIPLRGVIVEGETFSLSQKRLEFRSLVLSDSDDDDVAEEGGTKEKTASGASAVPIPSMEGGTSCERDQIPGVQRETVLISNLSNAFPLELKLTVEFPIEFPTGMDVLKISPLDADMCAVVPEGDRLSLNIELLNPKIGGLSEDVKIHIHDKNSLSRQPQTITVGIVEDTTGTLNLPTSVTAESPAEASVLEQIFAPARDVRAEVVGTDVIKSPTEDSSGLEETDDPSLCDAVSLSSMSPPDRFALSLSSRPSLTEQSISSAARRTSAYFQLRGCKRIGDRDAKSAGGEVDGLFELDLGQQDLSSNPVLKKIVLENTSLERVSYRIRTLSESDRSWVVFSRTEGMLEHPKAVSGGSSGGNSTVRDSHSVTISFMVGMRGVYSTYVFVENVDNPADTKTIRMSVEVVARQNIRRTATGTPLANPSSGILGVGAESIGNHVFDVYVHAVDIGSSTIEMDNLYFEAEHTGRSMVICNRESVPLEFMIKSSLSCDDETELMFSLSRTSAKLFRTVTIDPESQSRIYLRFRPSEGDFAMQTRRTLAEADTPVEKNIEIYINCRLVKDYQKIIPLRAICRWPQVRLSSNLFTFVGAIRKKDVAEPGQRKDEENPWIVSFRQPSSLDLEVTNLLIDPLEYEIVNDTMYFTLENLDVGDREADREGQSPPPDTCRGRRGGVWTMAGEGMHHVRITPNLEAIAKNADALRREKYILEHLTLYGKQRPTEKHFISLRLSFGHLTQFHTASGSRRSHGLLESEIVKLLREMDASPLVLLILPDPNSDNLESKKLSDKSSELYFKYTYIVDQLIYYGTREHAAEPYLQLANLLFTMLFGNSVFKDQAPAMLKEHPGTGAARCWPPALCRWKIEESV
ncbi:hypothetical protein HK104_006518 [Borealophlyctis nickersoniae]|nr:hypothetical protein HK104_006518 [Borealophlyctis nickersoniae]